MGKVKRKPREPLPNDPRQKEAEKKRRNRESAQKLRNNKQSEAKDKEVEIAALERQHAQLQAERHREEAKQAQLFGLLRYFAGFVSVMRPAGGDTMSDGSASPLSPVMSPPDAADLSPAQPTPSVVPVSPFSWPSPALGVGAPASALTTGNWFPGTTSAAAAALPLASLPASPSASHLSTIACPQPKGVENAAWMASVGVMLSMHQLLGMRAPPLASTQTLPLSCTHSQTSVPLAPPQGTRVLAT